MVDGGNDRIFDGKVDEVPVVDIQWDNYSYESAAEEHKSDVEDDGSPIIERPPPQNQLPHSPYDLHQYRNQIGHSLIDQAIERNIIRNEDEELARTLQFDKYEEAHNSTKAPGPQIDKEVTPRDVLNAIDRVRKEFMEEDELNKL